MQILKRANDFQSGEGVSAFESEANVREEAIRRSKKAGKGDVPRSCDMNKYRENYVKIFGHN